MKRKTMRKALVMVLALAMVCVASVAGTLAYLSHETGPVVNTFVVGKLFDNATADFAVWEHALVSSTGTNGVFTLKTGENLTKTNTYNNVLPGVDVPKDPFVRVDGLKEDAYLFLVVDDNTGEHINIQMETKWELYKTETNGDLVYVYEETDGDYTLSANAAQNDIGILLNDTVTVSKDFAGGDGINISFKAYIIQAAGLANRDAAWAAVNP